MARSFHESRFNRRRKMGEDINPSAYLVNLVDCMLVLACGFIVALIAYWNIDLGPVTELQENQLEEVDPEVLPEDVASGGSYYVELGKVYQDPNTGQVYMYQETEEEAADAEAADGAAANGADADEAGTDG